MDDLKKKNFWFHKCGCKLVKSEYLKKINTFNKYSKSDKYMVCDRWILDSMCEEHIQHASNSQSTI